MLRLPPKLRLIMLGLAFSAVLVCAFAPSPAYAIAPGPPDNAGQSTQDSPGTEVCGSDSERCNQFVEDYINPFLYLLSALVGVIAVIAIIISGIQYTSSADDPATVSKAKSRILNVIIGLVAYIFLFAFLEYLVPGGIR